MAINGRKYNAARQQLIDAGSLSASLAHRLHSSQLSGGVDERYGRQLLDESYQEFRRSGCITLAQFNALDAAARKMGIDNPAN